ncbi:diguanylate cyclase [Vibrio lentus]|nr:diguanylate cyclase [Vibrio lentus]
MRKNIGKWIEDESEQFSLLFIDIDNFKCVNDTHGHDFGDKVLKQIAVAFDAIPLSTQPVSARV